MWKQSLILPQALIQLLFYQIEAFSPRRFRLAIPLAFCGSEGVKRQADRNIHVDFMACLDNSPHFNIMF
jgi:hypothetical protein